MDHQALLRRIDGYCDTAPRATARTESIGPFTLYVARSGWSFYARPAIDVPVEHPYDSEELAAVAARQRELGVPVAFEWLHQTAPRLADAAKGAEMVVVPRPLLVLTADPDPGDVEATVRLLGPDDVDFAAARAAVSAGFADADELVPEPMAATIAERARDGLLQVAGAFDSSGAAIGGGTYARRNDVAELTGIAVLPRARGRGIGAALTALLAADARRSGATTIWLSATDDAVARVYERVGFARVGIAYEAEPAPPTDEAGHQ